MRYSDATFSSAKNRWTPRLASEYYWRPRVPSTFLHSTRPRSDSVALPAPKMAAPALLGVIQWRPHIDGVHEPVARLMEAQLDKRPSRDHGRESAGVPGKISLR